MRTTLDRQRQARPREGSRDESHVGDVDFIRTLTAWHRARDDARRYNRNLLQLGAAIAAILGIEAGSGGVFAIANGINGNEPLPEWASLQLIALTGFALVVGGIFGLLAIWSYFRRGQAEQKAEQNLEYLFTLDPEWATKLEG